MTQTPTLAVYIDANNDRNGNPRRGWMVVDQDGNTLAFVDEDYSGRASLTRRFPGVPETGRIAVTPGEYRSMLRAEKART